MTSSQMFVILAAVYLAPHISHGAAIVLAALCVCAWASAFLIGV